MLTMTLLSWMAKPKSRFSGLSLRSMMQENFMYLSDVFLSCFHFQLASFSLRYPIAKEVKTKKFSYDFDSFCFSYSVIYTMRVNSLLGLFFLQSERTDSQISFMASLMQASLFGSLVLRVSWLTISQQKLFLKVQSRTIFFLYYPFKDKSYSFQNLSIYED